MKMHKFFILSLFVIFISGCVVMSFYPLYTEKDLFPNDILTGSWMDNDSSEWIFEHPVKKENGIEFIDSTSYILTLPTHEEDEMQVFSVHIVKFGDHFFLDFYLEEWGQDQNTLLKDFHVIPVHTFAKLTVDEDSLKINWFNPNWLNDLIEKNRIRIHHENNGEFILLTAKPDELQKFVTKYVNSEEAFDDGMDAVLTRK
jgi:hypothetical protein